MEGKEKNNSRLLIVLVSVMSVVCISVLGFAGMLWYKGYTSESDSGESESDVIVDNAMDDSYNGYDFSYYNDTQEYLNVYFEYVKDTYPIVMKGNISDSEKEMILKDTNAFIMYTQEFTPSTPKTDQDNLLASNFFDFKLSAENLADYVKSYLYKNENVYLTFIKNSFKDAQIHIDTIAEIEKKYYK